jgi:hypothetical protein
MKIEYQAEVKFKLPDFGYMMGAGFVAELIRLMRLFAKSSVS